MMRFAKSRKIPAQGRGSAADSIVAYVLGITRVDPIRHELLFERFINEGRTAYPDVDIDLVLGGFHLAGATMEQRIAATAADLFDIVRPRILAPGHCTGWRAKAALAERFAPGRYAPSVVGTSFFLHAPEQPD